MSWTSLSSLFFFFLIPFCHAAKEEAEIYELLLANYSSLVRPVHDPLSSLTVLMKLYLQQIIHLDMKNQVMELNAWPEYTWRDYRLKWNPAEYAEIESVRFRGGEEGDIWQPDILLYNSCDDEHFDSTWKTNVIVYHDGRVNWRPPGVFKITCKVDITWFPFDEQSCSMQFSSWTYNGYALDLQIEKDNGTEGYSMDRSNYIPNGEWILLDAPAYREESYYDCCPEPYPTVKFFMLIRRNNIYYVFNIIVPSFLTSILTLLSFSLPPVDMSEKIGFQTTVLLSVCFFLTNLVEYTPPTSESVPLIGLFFAVLTMIVSVSTTFTITVLNIKYRHGINHRVSPRFRTLFLEVIPWLVLMRRPGHVLHRGRLSQRDPEGICRQCDTKCLHEHLLLHRKVGSSWTRHEMQRVLAQTKEEQLRRVLGRVAQDDILLLYLDIYEQVRYISHRGRTRKEISYRQEEWKMASMALDRFCLFLFSFVLTAFTLGMLWTIR